MWFTPVIIAVFFVFLFVVEKKLPLRALTRPLQSRLVVNFAVSILTLAIALAAVKPVGRWTLEWVNSSGVGILQMFGFKGVFGGIIGFLLMDLSFYYWHIANHKIPILWRFHNVHHSDPDLDVTTGFRFHPVEVGVSTLFRIAQIAIIGVSPATFVIYELFFQLNTFFHHSNLRLPISIERRLNFLIVTPRMHGIHHSNFQSETNSNYSVVFSFWDRLHKTILLGIPQAKITIGVAGYSKPQDNKLGSVLVMPFERQRNYWRIEGKELISRDKIKPVAKLSE